MKFQKFLFNRIFYWLTDLTILCLQTSITQKWLMLQAWFLHCSLLLRPRWPFHQPQQLQCLHHGSTMLTFVLLCAPFLSPQLCRWRFTVRTLWLLCETLISAVLAGALHMLFFAWNVVQSSWRQSIVVHHDQVTRPLFINSWACTLTILFFIMAGLIVYAVSPFIALCNGLKMSECEAYWLMDFPQSNS